jgi:hypothetical protein
VPEYSRSKTLSVAIGFGFQNILQNFLAGILLLWTEPFRIGDQIRIDPHEGTVEEIQTRATLIRTYDVPSFLGLDLNCLDTFCDPAKDNFAGTTNEPKASWCLRR